MLQQDQGIISFIIAGTIMFLLLGFFIVSFLFFYKKKQKQNKMEQELLRTTFAAEITKTQLEVQEQTMQTIGADLHDNIGQLLSLTSFTLHSVQFNDIPKAEGKINTAIDLMDRSIKEMRLLGKLLQGDQLLAMGLPAAIRHEINWMEKSGEYQVGYHQTGETPAANNPDKDLIFFRILQEVLNNIIKHSHANEIGIALEYGENTLRLKVTDNGVGFNMDEMPAEQRGMGLLNINKRAAIVGGHVSIRSLEDEGTCIEILIPYP